MKKILFVSIIAISGCFTDTTPGTNTNNNSTGTAGASTQGDTSNNKSNNNPGTTPKNSNNMTTHTTSGTTTIACVPSAEICDQKDNDCDGETDEGLADCCFADGECSDG